MAPVLPIKSKKQLERKNKTGGQNNSGTSSPSPSLLSNLNNRYRFRVFQPPISNEGITL